MFIRKSRVKAHISRAIERQRSIDNRHHAGALDRQRQHYEQLLERQRDEYEAIVEGLDRQVGALKKDIQDAENLAELIRFGAKSNHRISAELVAWAQRFLKTGAEAYREINSILDDASASSKKLERTK